MIPLFSLNKILLLLGNYSQLVIHLSCTVLISLLLEHR